MKDEGKNIDPEVAGVLRVKFRLRLFDSPYLRDPKAAEDEVFST